MFKLPPGFEMQLVAAEPEIQKPLNMAFDAQGRLWVTDSIEYPYAAPLDKPGRDTIKVIEFDYTTGKATKITTFADGLNIPIGVLPYKNGCIAHSIPNIWYFEDTDGDGKCDKRTKLYGPFDYSRDTHGMENAFRRGFDGWIYACHGFNNDSRVKGTDGHEVHMQSGNTFRFKPDGSRIEHYSHGQVNPFGMCFDDKFNIFTADCHSKPITQILRGGYYESFGKPHDGLGYVPSMMDHSHGSTAICGLVWVDGLMFPKEYRGNFLSGNVMTSRLNRNSLVYHGSTIKCKEEPDFLSCDDPWFRPVDLQIGPDGALYIADFYNRIIGHYEVPLPHPGRDRTSGRIWRLVYKGDAEGTKPAMKQKDLSKAKLDELIAELDHATLTQRLIAADELVNRVNVDPNQLKKAFKSGTNQQKAHILWVLSRTRGSFSEELLAGLGAEDTNLRLHSVKILAGILLPTPDEIYDQLVLLLRERLGDDDKFVACAAAQAFCSEAVKPNEVEHLIRKLGSIPMDDANLRYMVRRAIFGVLSRGTTLTINVADLSKSELDSLADIGLAIPTGGAAAFTLHYLEKSDRPASELLPFLTHSSRYIDPSNLVKLTEVVRTRFADDLELQLKALLALQQGLAQRGQSAEPLTAWAEELGGKVLDQAGDNIVGWENLPYPGAKDTDIPWTFQKRDSADGNKDGIFYSSLPRGEKKTGIYRSQAFELPENLSFWCAGHVGPPGQSFDLNYIRLRDAKTNELLIESRPPRNDLAQRIEWDLAKFKGKQGHVEIVDGDTGSGYAWLAVGRFSVEGLNPNEKSQRQQLVAKLAAELKLTKLQPRLAMLFTSGTLDSATRGAIGSALVAMSPDARAAALVRIVSEPNSETAARQDIAEAIASLEAEQLDKALVAALSQVPARVQTAVAEILASDVNGATTLLSLVEQGKLSANVVRLPMVEQKIAALKNAALSKQAAELTAKLPPANEALEKLIAERRKSLDSSKPDLAKGAELFTKHCAVCHQLAGKGAVIGPQLDGIGLRGVDRLVEDVLDPNRNVDVAFRTTTFALADGRVISGLPRREEGEQLVIADSQGKEIRIAKSEIEERTPSAQSLMPANVVEIVSPADFQHLLGYLARQKSRPIVEK